MTAVVNLNVVFLFFIQSVISSIIWKGLGTMCVYKYHTLILFSQKLFKTSRKKEVYIQIRK